MPSDHKTISISCSPELYAAFAQRAKGLYLTKSMLGAFLLQVHVEKDYTLLDRKAFDEAYSFPHPFEGPYTPKK